MKKIRIIMIAIVITLAMSVVAFADEAPQEVFDLATSRLATIGKEPVIIEAVKAANAEKKPLSSIKELDKKWKAKRGVADHLKTLMDNPCGKYLRGLQSVEPYIAEAFAMDNQGANTCMTGRTSDYWLGNKNTFVVPYNSGRGGIFIGAVEFDDNAQVSISQVSVPVVEGGKVIGAITFGVDIDQLNLSIKRIARK